MTYADDDLSRLANGFLWGDPSERLCARAWRLRWRGWWPAVWLLDLRFRQLTGERGHCRRVWREDRDGVMDPDQRARLAGL